MRWGPRTAINQLTKPPSNDHSCRNLACTDANCSGVDATESSPYNVKNDNILYARVGLVVVSSSFGTESGVPSSRAGGPSDIFEQFTRFNWK